MYFYYSVSSDQCSSINTIVITEEKIVHLSLEFCFLWFKNTLIQFQTIYSVFLNFFYNLLDIQ